MAKIVDRLVSQLMAKGKSKSSAYAIAIASLQRSKNLKTGTKTATAKGYKRGNMTPSERAKDRQSNISGKPKSAYTYNSSTNRATLKA